MPEEIVAFVNNTAFPIVAFLLMFYQSNTVIKENTAALNKLCLAIEEEV